MFDLVGMVFKLVVLVSFVLFFLFSVSLFLLSCVFELLVFTL